MDVDPSPALLLQCEWAWVNYSRADWIFYGLQASPPGFVDVANHAWGSTLKGGEIALDFGDVYYGGSLVLDVPADGAGTFTIGFLSGAGRTFLSDENNDEIEPLALTAAKITILCANACDDEDECTSDECTPGGCTHSFVRGCGSVPAVSGWGIVVLTLVLLIYGKLRFSVWPRTR